MTLSPQQTKILRAIKERRFTSTARILGEEKAVDAKVQVVDQLGAAVAWWQHHDKTIVLNDAEPQTTSPKMTLVWERAKLFHELFHLLFTDNDALRKQLAGVSKNTARYLWLSNALEDGRIEHHGGKLYEGTTWYIRTLLKHLVQENSPDSGLLLYVRTHLWRNAKEAKFWSKYQAQIDEAITAKNSTIVWHIAAKIVDDIEANKPKKPVPPKQPDQCRCPDCGAPIAPAGARVNVMPATAMLAMAASVCATCGATTGGDSGDGGNTGGGEDSGDSGDTGDSGNSDGDSGDSDSGDSDSDGDSGDSTSDGDGDSSGEDCAESDSGDSEGGDSGEGEQSDSGASGGVQGGEPPTDAKIDKAVEEAIRDMVDEAMEEIDREIDEELIDLDAELASFEQEQEYATPQEAFDADKLAELFASLMVESSRQRYESCKYGGTLDTRRLLETQTGGEFMHERIEKASQPHVVLLIDESVSMQYDAAKVSTAARILNGAIQASGAKSIAVSFGDLFFNPKTGNNDQIKVHPVVPLAGFGCNGGDTPTHLGLAAASKWLEEENAKRGLVIVITDGMPTSPTATTLRFQALQNEGFYVLDVLLGKRARTITPERLASMSHEWVYIENPADLVKQLEVPLGNFMAGAF